MPLTKLITIGLVATLIACSGSVDDKKTAEVTVPITFKNEQGSSNKVRLIQTKDGWKIKL